MNSQDNSRPFICAECGSSFKKKWNLKVHMESHSDPFECKVCHLKFKFRHKLRSHMGRHTGVIKYSCKKCPAVFGYKQMLISHMNIQHRSLSNCWYCPGCGAHFSKSDDLETHGKLCLCIKKCEDDDEDDNKSILFQDSEELAQNTNKIVTEEPLLFEDEGSKQLRDKRLITEQDRRNSEVDKDEGNACSQFSKSREGHENRLERDSDMVASIVTIEDTEERGSRNEGSVENANSREFVNNGNYTPGNLISEECHRISHGNSEKSVISSSDDSVLDAELHVASEAVREIDNIHKSNNHRLSVAEVPLHSPDVSQQCQRSFDSENTVKEVTNSSICNQETKSADGLKSGMVQIPVSIVKKLLLIVNSVPKTKAYELDERSDVVVDKEIVSNIGQDETSSDVLVESKEHLEALVSEFSENENSMHKVDGEAHQVSSEGILRTHLHKSTVSAEENAACLISVDALQTKNRTINSKTSETTQRNLIDPLAKISKNMKIPEVSCSTKGSSLQADQLEHSCVSNKKTPDLHSQIRNKHRRDKRTHCRNPEVATKASRKGKLLRKSSETAASDASIDSHVVNVNRKRKQESKGK
ncbi:protein suppressor of hairy wing-like [Penaeus indicus]|uniref:protein suppressor of hairy wing-like n=1 Tax=Penaeus indicus TaxID=29960 RepID=UPI00300DADB0